MHTGRKFLLTLLLSLTYAVFGGHTPPNITAHDAYIKAQEIFYAHISQKEFNALIAERTLSNYLEELDPLKAYFTLKEINPYLHPSDALLARTIKEYKNQEFTVFAEIYDHLLIAIERRNSLEAKLDQETNLPKGVHAHEIIESGWAEDDSALYNKILKIRALQKASAEKLSSEKEASIFFQRLQRRRIHHEKELIGTSKGERKKEMLAYFLKSLASSLDTHTAYFTPQEAKQFLMQVQQRLFGIGAQLRDDLDGLTVVQVVEGGPAWRSGELKVGDKIVSVNHEIIVGMDTQEAIDLIRGPKGSRVILTLLRENGGNQDKFDIELMRDEIVIADSRYETHLEPFGDGSIGYIAIHSFYQDPKYSSASDLRKALTEMEQKTKIYGLILDLRGNTGGLLPQAVDVTGAFIHNGVVAAIKDCRGGEQRLRSLAGDPLYKGPLIVLTNRASASASEIVALCLADYGRALIVGDETTYGKGSYQTFTIEGTNPEEVHESGEYKVTRGRYYTVGGKTPQLVGVKADIEVPGLISQMKIGEKYNKYPLESDEIAPLFVDDLADTHPLYRMRLKKMLGKTLQKKEETLNSLKPDLIAHSKDRIQNNPSYQNLLKELPNIDKYEMDASLIGQNDLQLEEAYNIMKELILLSDPVES